MAKDFFPPKPEIKPTIYAYELIGVGSHKGLLKVGYTVRNAKDRVAEQLKTARLKFKIILEEAAIRNDGTAFTDFEVHQHLIRRKVRKVDGEWFKCAIKDVRAAINDIRDRKFNFGARELNFKMRPEQQEAVEKTATYFLNYKKDNAGKTPHFLWNAKMRFGKTFATYQLAKKMGWKKILVMTFKPAVE